MEVCVVLDESLVDDMADMQVAMALETEGVVLERERVREGVRGLIRRKDMGLYVVARDEDKDVVGMCGVTYEWSDWRNGVFWWIQSVYVKPRWRRQGVFQQMYGYLLEKGKTMAEAQEMRCCGVRLYHEKDNEAARKTYQKMGMEDTDYRMMEVDFVLHRTQSH